MKTNILFVPDFSELDDENSLVNSLYNVSVNDLNASLILYNNQQYSQSVFFLQQSVEKATKSLSLHLNIIREDELTKKIGHNPPEIYKKLIKTVAKGVTDILNETNEDQKKKNISSSTNADLDPFIETIENMKRELNRYIISFKEDYSLSEEKFLDLLYQLASNNNQYLDLLSVIDNYLTEKQFKRHIGTVQLISDIILFIWPLDKTKKDEYKLTLSKTLESLHPLREILEPMLRALISLFSAGILLFYLSLITTPHAMRARYPYPLDNITPERFYNPELPLIRDLDKLLYYADSAIEAVGIFYDSILDFIEIAERNPSPKPKAQQISLKAGEDPDD